MKKIILLLLVCCTIVTTKAQLNAGEKAIGGSISFNLQDYNTNNDQLATPSRYARANAFITLGKFISPARERGFLLSYSLSSQTNWYGNDVTTITHTIGAGYFRNYYKSIGKNFFLSLNWNISGNGIFSAGPDSSANGEPVMKTKGWGISTSINPGIIYKIDKRWLVTMQLNNIAFLGYSHLEEQTIQPQNSYTTTTNDLTAYSSLNNVSLGSISIGFKYIMNPK
ncbi:hypothetical protein [Ferruginibacter albus]|uniref:hypothetical protein n=1 Tax=Ferruginibacter albus TaxID=2875540 RepID=UPI001CC50B51|nr:hypothetical protein [Ferruginibacter albus]UAY51750.1 hypothetical protein K9M53_14280 [Ferruginibacter albus]